MRAWQLTAFDTPLTYVETPDPVAGPDEVVLDIKAAGLCHTDISFIDGHVPGMPTHLPIVLGHEVAGVISEIGNNVSGFAVGERVAIAAEGISGPGVGRDGGYAEKTIARPAELIRFADNVLFAAAAAGTDAGATSHHAVALAGVTQGTRVGIIGLGGLGLTGARIAVLRGGEVHAVDVREERRHAAEAVGVASFGASVADLAPLGLDVIIDFAGVDTTGPAIEAVRPGGTVVQIGAGKPDATISTMLLVTKSVSLLGSLGFERDDVEQVFRYLAEGTLTLEISTISFDEIGDGLDALRAGRVAGRSVAVRD